MERSFQEKKKISKKKVKEMFKTGFLNTIEPETFDAFQRRKWKKYKNLVRFNSKKRVKFSYRLE